MKRGVKVAIVVVVLVAVAVAAVVRRKRQLAQAKALGGRPVPVAIAKVTRGEFVAPKRYVGIMVPFTTANVSARITSEITKILHREGEKVSAGGALINLDDRNLKQAVAVAKARIENVKTQIAANKVNTQSLKASVDYWQKQMARDRVLHDQDIVPAKQLETSTEQLNEATGRYKVALQRGKTLLAELAAAEGALSLAETNLSYAKIRAPFDCVVCEVPVDPGDLAVPGKQLMVVEFQTQLKLQVQVPQVDMRSVKVGDKLDVITSSSPVVVPITKIYPSVGSDKMVRVEAVIPKTESARFVSGQYVLAYLDNKVLGDVLIVPSGAVNIDNSGGDGSFVFVVRGGKLVQIPVKVLSNNETKAAVSGDLKVGDEVVVSAFLGWAKLANGLAVMPLGKVAVPVSGKGGKSNGGKGK